MPDLHFPALPDPQPPGTSTSIRGWNRAEGACLIDARSDIDAVLTWLSEFKASRNTHINYKKEVERFLLWASIKQGKTLSSISREDILNYDRFLEHPDPSWCGQMRPRQHPEWKPFARYNGKPDGLSPASRKQSLIIIGALYRYLVDAGYLQRNPLAIGRRKRKAITKEIHDERLLEKDTLRFLMDWLDTMPRETLRDIQHAERSRWLIALFYFSAARLSEIAGGKMGDFRLVRGNWWINITGKGDKTRAVPVDKPLLDALQRYRAHLGLSSMPAPGEDAPIVAKLHGIADHRYQGMKSSALYITMKEIMGKAALDAQDCGYEQIAMQLNQSSTHWLRHTSASHQLDGGVPLLTVSQNLGHAKLETTRRYLHTEDDARHESSRGWGIDLK